MNQLDSKGGLGGKCIGKLFKDDAGCQNLYLASGAISAGMCAIGAYHQEEMALLKVDGNEELTIYAGVIEKIYK